MDSRQILIFYCIILDFKEFSEAASSTRPSVSILMTRVRPRCFSDYLGLRRRLRWQVSESILVPKDGNIVVESKTRKRRFDC
jgi:hypothetical protein